MAVPVASPIHTPTGASRVATHNTTYPPTTNRKALLTPQAKAGLCYSKAVLHRQRLVSVLQSLSSTGKG
eukprot:7669758-Pyramimonas_sp.AAC.1